LNYRKKFEKTAKKIIYTLYQRFNQFAHAKKAGLNRTIMELKLEELGPYDSIFHGSEFF